MLTLLFAQLSMTKHTSMIDRDSSLSSISDWEANTSFMADLAPYFLLGVDHE